MTLLLFFAFVAAFVSNVFLWFFIVGIKKELEGYELEIDIERDGRKILFSKYNDLVTVVGRMDKSIRDEFNNRMEQIFLTLNDSDKHNFNLISNRYDMLRVEATDRLNEIHSLVLDLEVEFEKAFRSDDLRSTRNSIMRLRMRHSNINIEKPHDNGSGVISDE